MTPEHQTFVRNVTPERNEQEPLGPQPSYDDVLDVAVEYTFPASDPVAVQSCCKEIDRREHQSHGPQDKPESPERP
ncbi:MAG TPA: hypothetical protein VFE82_19055 [Ramlibacter sp.]|uniref:hypothetical protein n=1 Tax=Ramlibacter sp. TaxID=1917967 RepID=UPI002D2CF6C3|nr:hypothetical protein [Ramlibacter sp.]HZY20577.1 hypothetical protein [Ramlibacter sp.]